MPSPQITFMFAVILGVSTISSPSVSIRIIGRLDTVKSTWAYEIDGIKIDKAQNEILLFLSLINGLNNF